MVFGKIGFYGLPIRIMHPSSAWISIPTRRVQRQSGGWAITGKIPVPSEGWTPFEAQEPWQDRQTLISHRDQRLAILRMVFVSWAAVLSRTHERKPNV
jgi:hypothetical protein